MNPRISLPMSFSVAAEGDGVHCEPVCKKVDGVVCPCERNRVCTHLSRFLPGLENCSVIDILRGGNSTSCYSDRAQLLARRKQGALWILDLHCRRLRGQLRRGGASRYKNTDKNNKQFFTHSDLPPGFGAVTEKLASFCELSALVWDMWDVLQLFCCSFLIRTPEKEVKKSCKTSHMSQAK